MLSAFTALLNYAVVGRQNRTLRITDFCPTLPRCQVSRLGSSMVTFVFLGDQLKQFPELFHSPRHCSLSYFKAHVKIVTPLTILIIRSYDSCHSSFGRFVVAVHYDFDNAFSIFFWAWNQRQAERTNFKSKVIKNRLNWCRTWI